jgi:2,5-dichlorohydroquinone reductive dechlorinase
MMIIGGRDTTTGAMIPAENYHPGYVRLRLEGARQADLSFAGGYTGVASVTTQGLDPCAVPTLIDRETGAVVVDSMRICEYLDRATSGGSLVPSKPEQADRMRVQLRAVDVTPHPGLLYGFHPDDDSRPEILRQLMVSVYDEKVEALRKLVDDNADDPVLIKAYEVKIAKESGGKSVSRNSSFQRALRSRTREILEAFENDLSLAGHPWICGPEVTLADLFWAVSLVRLRYLGLGRLWSDLPEVAGFYRRVAAFDSVREEVIRATLDSMPPSIHLSERDV